MHSVFTVNFGLRFCFAFSLGDGWYRSSCDIWEDKIRQISVLGGKYANLQRSKETHTVIGGKVVRSEAIEGKLHPAFKYTRYASILPRIGRY